MTKSFLLSELAKEVGGSIRGDAGTRISGVNSISQAGPEDLTWLAAAKYGDALNVSRAGAVVVSKRYGETPMPALLVEDPEQAFAQLLARFADEVPRPETGIHPTAIIAQDAQIDAGVAVGPYTIIGKRARVGRGTVIHGSVHLGDDVRLGADCELWPGVMIRERCTLGERVIVHGNTVIGADGFGYLFRDGRHVKIPQIGTVEIGDDVEIGAGCCIDRAKFGATRIGAGTKIDNQVQVAHNVQIGPNCILVAQVGIAGSAQLGAGVVLAGKVGIHDNVSLGEGSLVAACACVSKDVRDGAKVIGIPAQDMDQWVRERAKVKQLPRMADQLKELIRRIERLEASADD